MIADLILNDHQAAIEIFAVAGNAALEAHDERAEEFRRFLVLWGAHTAMMDEVVYPQLLQAAGRADLIEPACRQQHQLEAMAYDLAARAPAEADHENWTADFERVKAAFERQRELEETRIVALIQEQLTPEQRARMTREGRAVRQARLARE